MPKDCPALWMRLHLHTPSSHDIQEGWLREVRSLMGMVISTTTFDDHAVLVRMTPSRCRSHHGIQSDRSCSSLHHDLTV